MMNVTSGCVVVAGASPQVVTWVENQTSPHATDSADVTPGTVPSNNFPALRGLGHRLAEARQREGVTRRAMARRLGVPVRKIEELEQSNDVMLSDLQQWQHALGVPLSELVNEPEGPFASPVQLRAKMLLVMKTVRSIQERTKQVPVRRLAETLATQIVEMMPELKEVMPWPVVGHQRKKRDLGQAFFRGLTFGSFEEPETPDR